jgi:hypothetical protein
MTEKTLIDNIAPKLLLSEVQAYEAWGCMYGHKDHSKSCTHVVDTFEKWCPSCRAYGILAFYEHKLPTQELRKLVASYLSTWKKKK